MPRWVREAFKTPSFVVFLILTVALLFVAVGAPFIAPNDPIATDYGNILAPPSAKYPLGTDEVGRCILSRLIWGGRTSLPVVLIVTALSAVIGITLGTLAGYCGGIVDTIISRITDLVMSLPQMVFVIAFVGMMGSGLGNAMIAMTMVGWCEYARISRSLTMSLRSRAYVDEARLAGISPIGVIFHYILPNIAPQFAVILTQGIGDKLLSLAGLSLLGMTSQPPTPEWGFMLSEGRKFIQSDPRMITLPGLVIVGHVVVFSLLGDRLQDVLAPGYRARRKQQTPVAEGKR